MDFTEIPDDVWIEVFERVDEPQQLAILVRTCHRFRDLASKPLLRELRWSKASSTLKNIDAWNDVYRDVLPLPRRLTVGVPFEFTTRLFAGQSMTPENKLHDAIWGQMPRFSSLNELVLDGTTISPYSYTVLAQIPTLRSLRLLNCTYLRLPVSFDEYSRHSHSRSHNLFPGNFAFASLLITHFSLHKVNGQVENDHLHPISLIKAANLSSLSITWTGSMALAYAFGRPTLPNLTDLDVVMPILTRDLVDSLVNFVQSCVLGPRIQLSIERHNLSDQQIGAVQFPLKGVWSYRGPLPIASFSMPRKLIRESTDATLTHVVMNEPLDLSGLLDGLERLPKCIETLEIQVRRWDIEVLFAIRELFPKISSLVIRYGKGTFPVDFFVTLGANILFDLPKLVTMKLLHDTSCIVAARQINNVHHFGAYPLGTHQLMLNFNFEEEQHEHESEPQSSAASILEQGDLKDYLIGWNRYCKCLRYVQLNPNTWWERRFEGDLWTETSSI